MKLVAYLKQFGIRSHHLITLLVLGMIMLWPSQVFANVTGWIRCNLNARDICFTEGSVGIGTTNPENKLDVTGTGRFSDTLFLSGTSGDLLVSDNSIFEFKRIVLTNDDIINANHITIHDPGQNEGISWNEAGAKIYVAPFDNANTDGYLRLINDGGIAFEPGAENNQAMTLLANGRLGIGTTNPQDFVHLFKDAPVTVGILMGNSYVGNDRSGFLVNYHHSGQGAELWNFENTDMWFGTNNSRRMTIENDGDIGIGTHNPNSKLEVSGGYLELDTHDGTPPGTDCDAPDEVGRMMVDSRRPYLYICSANGWVRK
jgi:hypothetical protein